MPKSPRTPLGRESMTGMEQTKSKKAGRPQKGVFKRSHTLTVSFNDDEFAMMTDKARRSGFPPATYCRKAAVRETIRETLTCEDRKLLRGLWNIGGNLNQIARSLNRTGQIDIAPIRTALTEIKTIVDYYREVMRYGR